MTNKRRAVPGVHPYDGPAGGWGALKATAIAVRTQMDAFEAPATLLRTNQPDGLTARAAPGRIKNINRPSSFAKRRQSRDLGGDRPNGWRPAFLAANTVSSLLAKAI